MSIPTPKKLEILLLLEKIDPQGLANLLVKNKKEIEALMKIADQMNVHEVAGHA